MTPALDTIVLERIAELLRYRSWYVRNPWARGPEWDDMRHDDRVELRALVRLARKARKHPAPDPMDLAKSYADWTSGELVAGFGR